MINTALLIDGGYIRAIFHRCRPKTHFTSDVVIGFADACFKENEHNFRIFYYDAPKYTGELKNPVSGESQEYSSKPGFLERLSQESRFAVRRGRLAFRGWKLVESAWKKGTPLQAVDAKPIFEQKGVDMRIGLDIASLAQTGKVERIILVSGDSDMEPALKHARIGGLETAVVRFFKRGNYAPHKSLLAHADIVRDLPTNVFSGVREG